jgi:hypothetical protein
MNAMARQGKKNIPRLDPAAVGIEAKNRTQSLFGAGTGAFEQLCDAE